MYIELWRINSSPNASSLGIEKDTDELVIKYKGSTFTYKDDKQLWYGFINGRIVKIPMPSLKTVIKEIEKLCP